MRIEIDDLSRPQVLALLEEHLRNMYELSPSDQVFAFDASKLRAPGVTVWTAWDDDALAGCIALKELSPTQAELKSMRTPAARRRQGAGRALLDHVLQHARQRGYHELFLETGRHPAFQPAQTLYRSAGFRDCGPFGDYKENGNSVFMSMRLSTAKLIFFCGKMASGKSTLATALAEREQAVLLSQDVLLDTLFPNLIVNVASYLEYSGRVNRMLAPHVVDVLSKGLSVVLDFPANTRNQRAWFREIIDRAGVEHELHLLDTPDDICKAQLKARSAHLPPGTKWTTEEDFDLIASHFRAPEADERFTVIRHTRE